MGGYSVGRVIDGSDGLIINNNIKFKNYIFIFYNIDKLVVLFQGILKINPLYAAGSPTTKDISSPENI
jgi:hypothetical protein